MIQKNRTAKLPGNCLYSALKLPSNCPQTALKIFGIFRFFLLTLR
nr:MAG TPA: hypothetical protein [Caudoviricetes sp.]